MTTLPATPQESKPKTLAEIAKVSNQPPKPPANPNQKLVTRGSRLNNQMEAELEKFIGRQVTVKVNSHDTETVTGVCVAFSVNMNLVIRTETEKIFLRSWQSIRRLRTSPGAPR